MGRIENNLTEQVWVIAKKYENLWDLRTALSAGVAALELLDAAGREKACGIAKGEIEYEFIIKTKKDDAEPDTILAAQAATAAEHDTAKKKRTPKKKNPLEAG